MALSEQTKTYLKAALAQPAAAQDLVDHIDSIATSQLDAGSVTSAKMEQSLQRYADISIAHAAILTLGTVPVTLLAAPGAGYANVVDAIVSDYDYNSAAYTLAAETVDVEYASGATLMVAMLNADFVGTADIRKYVKPAVTGVALVENSALKITTSGNTDPGGGNASATLKFRVYYRIVPYDL